MYNTTHHSQAQKILDKAKYLDTFDNKQYGTIDQQPWAKSNIEKFHNFMKMKLYQCKICNETWPSMQKAQHENHICHRCAKHKGNLKRFSEDNFMLPSPVPKQLQGLTQTEEMLISHALPIMSVYVKPGGQRAYKGHCINLPQNIQQLADCLPHYPKDVSVIIVRMKGKSNTFKDVIVRRQKVQDALNWLIPHNPHYRAIKINQHSLNSLQENGIPSEIQQVDCDSEQQDICDPELGAQNDDDQDIAFDENSEMNSPIPQTTNKEAEAICNHLHHESISSRVLHGLVPLINMQKLHF